ncbi:MAG TPA: hypothetical protein VGI85_03470, partial [Chthoniobacterales bacterium]
INLCRDEAYRRALLAADLAIANSCRIERFRMIEANFCVAPYMTLRSKRRSTSGHHYAEAAAAHRH